MYFYDVNGSTSYDRNSEGIMASDFLRGKFLNDGASLCYFSPGIENGPSDRVLRTSGYFVGEDPSFHV